MTLGPMRYYKPSNELTEGSTKYRRRVSKDSDDGIAELIIVIALLVFMCIALFATIMKLREEAKFDAVEIILLNDRITSLETQLMDAVHVSSVGRIEKELLKKEILDISSKRVKVTGYHPNSGGINSDSNPSLTATMTPHKAGYTCAISTALVDAGWLGKEIYIDGFGMVLANDRLAPGIKGYQIDLCKGSYKDAMVVGENLNVLATLVSRDVIKQKLEEN